MAMTRDDVIRMAKEAGLISPSPYTGVWDNYAAALERFADLVAKAERESGDSPWKAAVIDQLIIAHILGADQEADPRKAVADLMAYHSETAVDPRVSEAACKLIEDEREACAKVCEDYEEHIETLRDGEYQAELAGRQAGAARCTVAIRARGGE